MFREPILLSGYRPVGRDHTFQQTLQTSGRELSNLASEAIRGLLSLPFPFSIAEFGTAETFDLGTRDDGLTLGVPWRRIICSYRIRRVMKKENS